MGAESHDNAIEESEMPGSSRSMASASWSSMDSDSTYATQVPVTARLAVPYRQQREQIDDHLQVNLEPPLPCQNESEAVHFPGSTAPAGGESTRSDEDSDYRGYVLSSGSAKSGDQIGILEGMLGLERLTRSLYYRTREFSRLIPVAKQLGECVDSLGVLTSFLEVAKFSENTAGTIAAKPIIASVTSGLLLTDGFEKEFSWIERYSENSADYYRKANLDCGTLSDKFLESFRKHARIWEKQTLLFESFLPKYVPIVSVRFSLTCS
jgi:hypothetical protein